MPRVFIPAQLRSLTGAAQVEVEGATVREVVNSLEARFPGIRERLCQGDQLAPSRFEVARLHPPRRGAGM
jgi:sulfur-carrier protein